MKVCNYKVVAKLVSQKGNIYYSLVNLERENLLAINCYIIAIDRNVPKHIEVGDVLVGNVWYNHDPRGGFDRFVYKGN